MIQMQVGVDKELERQLPLFQKAVKRQPLGFFVHTGIDGKRLFPILIINDVGILCKRIADKGFGGNHHKSSRTAPVSALKTCAA